MKKEHKTIDLYNPDSDKPYVEKNLLELSKTIQPGFVMSAGQKKTMNAVQFFVQSYAAKYFTSQGEFHAAYEERVMQLHIPKTHFMSLIAFNSRNTKHLKTLISEMTNIEVSYDNGLEGDAEAYEFTKLIPKAGVQSGYVYFDIPPDTRRALVSPKIEAVIDVLKVAENLNGKYSISLYQLLHGHFERMEESSCEVQIDDEFLRNALNVPYKIVDRKRQWSYGSVAEFNAKVLKKSVAEINGAELEFKVKYKRKKLKSGEIIWRFEITRTTFAKYALIASAYATEITEIIKELKNYGVKNWEKVITAIESEKDLLYFQYCINEVNKAIRSRSPKAKVIKNKAGYFIKALEGNKESFEEHFRALQRQREKERKHAQEIERANVEAQKKSKKDEQRRELRRVAFSALSAADAKELKDKFIDSIRGAVFGTQYSAIQELGLEQAIEESNLLRGLWNNFLDEELDITDEKVERSIANMRVKGVYL